MDLASMQQVRQYYRDRYPYETPLSASPLLADEIEQWLRDNSMPWIWEDRGVPQRHTLSPDSRGVVRFKDAKHQTLFEIKWSAYVTQG